MSKILIVDDEEAIRNLIRLTLSIENYTVEEAEDGEIALQMIENHDFDLILLDIMLPKIDGYHLMETIKSKRIPVIFITAKISLQDKILGLKLGGDDYITKPFEPMELLARIEALLRRTKENQTHHSETYYQFQHVKLYPNQRVVTCNDQEVILTMKEFDLLTMFFDNINLVLSRETLLERVWGYDYYGGTRTVDMHIKELRKKLNLQNDLETIYKVGYKLKGTIYEIKE